MIYLKLVSAIFYQIFIFHGKIAMKNVFYWTPVHLSVRPSVRPSVLLSVRKFSQNWLISFF